MERTSKVGDKPLELIGGRRGTGSIQSTQQEVEHKPLQRKVANLCRILYGQTLLKKFFPIAVLGR
jgi:hypothetical protein